MYEYLPSLFGIVHFHQLIGDYKGYDPSADPTIMTEFSSAAYRIGHPYIPQFYKQVNNNNETLKKMDFVEIFINNNRTFTHENFEYILKGLSFTLAKERNMEYIDLLRDFTVPR